MADRIGQIKSLKKPQNIEHAPILRLLDIKFYE